MFNLNNKEKFKDLAPKYLNSTDYKVVAKSGDNEIFIQVGTVISNKNQLTLVISGNPIEPIDFDQPIDVNILESYFKFNPGEIEEIDPPILYSEYRVNASKLV